MAFNPVWMPPGPPWNVLIGDLGEHYLGWDRETNWEHPNYSGRRGDQHPPVGMDPVHGGPVPHPDPSTGGNGGYEPPKFEYHPKLPKDHTLDKPGWRPTQRPGFDPKLAGEISKMVKQAIPNMGGNAGFVEDAKDMTKSKMPFRPGTRPANTPSYGRYRQTSRRAYGKRSYHNYRRQSRGRYSSYQSRYRRNYYPRYRRRRRRYY